MVDEPVRPKLKDEQSTDESGYIERDTVVFYHVEVVVPIPKHSLDG
jgi:hypothetical protein